MAAIPDSNGTIHGCYSNTTRVLTVIDTGLGQTCTTRQTPLNWSQFGGPIAYAHLLIDSGGNVSLDANRSKNVTAVYSNPATFRGFVCLTVSGTPKTISAIGGYGSVAPTYLAFKDQAGWSTNPANGSANVCNLNAPTANVALHIDSSTTRDPFDDFVTIY
ncbi:hypothetical protein BVY00_00410 [bacterium G20]|nr:hypothetical protein BVY00_00410 [bacterium G20]